MRVSRRLLTIGFALLGTTAALADDTKDEIRIGQESREPDTTIERERADPIAHLLIEGPEHFALIAAHEHDLLTYAQERLREINSLRLIGTARGKGPVISFEMKGAHAHDVATVIDRQGIAVRAGTHCVMPLLERFNVTATCRASFGMYNTREEVDHLAQALIKARELFS